NLGKGKAPSSSSTKGKGKKKESASITNSREAVMFCVPIMKGLYAICKGRSITVEERFELVGENGQTHAFWKSMKRTLSIKNPTKRLGSNPQGIGYDLD
ncbi:hypothetical protein HAX54_025112, partial [Datura stramonium]|nr:hypothetical protein [Datura stramonium]